MMDASEAEKLLLIADKIIRQYLQSAARADKIYQEMLNSLRNETDKMTSEVGRLDPVVQEYPKLLYEAHYVLRQLTKRLESKSKVPFLEEGWTPTLAALNRITNRIREKLELPPQRYTLQQTERRLNTYAALLHDLRKQQRRDKK